MSVGSNIEPKNPGFRANKLNLQLVPEAKGHVCKESTYCLLQLTGGSPLAFCDALSKPTSSRWPACATRTFRAFGA